MTGKIILLVFGALAMLLVFGFLVSELVCYIQIRRAQKRLEKLKMQSKRLDFKIALDDIRIEQVKKEISENEKIIEELEDEDGICD